MSNMKCPFCQRKLEQITTSNPLGLGRIEMAVCKKCMDKGVLHIMPIWDWQELIRTRKALGYAIDVIQTVAKMSDKMSREYGETLVEQLDNIQAYCWQEGYVLTHEEDLERAMTALEQKDK